MSSQLVQSRFLQKRTFVLADTGAAVFYKNPFKKVYQVKYEARFAIYVFIHKGRRVLARLDQPFGIEFYKSGGLNKPLDSFIAQLIAKRKAFLSQHFSQINQG